MGLKIVKILDRKKIVLSDVDPKSCCDVTFIRVGIEDLNETIGDVIKLISDLSWINKFDSLMLRESYKERAEPTIGKLSKKLKDHDDSKVTKQIGETIVSCLSVEAIADDSKYLNIPLGEMVKERISNNGGFDFFSENLEKNIIIFGEAKYKSKANAHNRALRQVIKFVEKKKADVKDFADIERFVSMTSGINMLYGAKGYAVGFSSLNDSTEDLIENIKSNKYFKQIIKYSELICVAVNING